MQATGHRFEPAGLEFLTKLHPSPPPSRQQDWRSGLSEQDLAWESMNAEQWNNTYNRSSGNIQPSIDSYHRYQLANPNINTGYNANGQKVRLTGFGPNGRGIWTPVYE